MAVGGLLHGDGDGGGDGDARGGERGDHDGRTTTTSTANSTADHRFDRASHVEVLRRSIEEDYNRAETLRREMHTVASEEADFTAPQLRAALLSQGDELVRLYMRAVAGARHVLDFDARQGRLFTDE